MAKRDGDKPIRFRVMMSVEVIPAEWAKEYGEPLTKDTLIEIKNQMRDTAHAVTQAATRHLPVSITIHDR